MGSHDSQKQRPLPHMPVHDQPHKASVQPIEPDTQGHKAVQNTSKACANAEGGSVRKRAATVGVCVISPGVQHRDHRSKLQSKQRRSSSAAARERFHKTCGPSVSGSGEAIHKSQSQRNATQRLESSCNSNLEEVSQVKQIHSESTVGNEKARKVPKTPKAAKRTAVDGERFSTSKNETQGASPRSEQAPKTWECAGVKSCKSNAQGNSTAKFNPGYEALVQTHGRNLEQDLQKPAQTMEGTVARTVQSNFEVRALVKSDRAYTQMASPVLPPSPIHSRRSLPVARAGGFATLPLLMRRQIDIPLRRCTCQDLPPYFLQLQKRLPSLYSFGLMDHGGPLEFFAIISQIMNCRGHHEGVRDHCRSLWNREAKRPGVSSLLFAAPDTTDCLPDLVHLSVGRRLLKVQYV